MVGGSNIRHKVEPRDVPAVKAARRLHLTLTEFEALLPALIARGFPEADHTTGMYDLDAIDEWRRARHPHLFLTTAPQARHASAVVPERLEKMGNG